MTTDFIKVARDQSAATEAAELLAFIAELRRVYELGTRVRAKMRHNFDDSNPNAIVWTSLETLWGVPTGKGAAVFTFIDGAIGAMEGTFQTAAAKNLTESVG